MQPKALQSPVKSSECPLIYFKLRQQGPVLFLGPLLDWSPGLKFQVVGCCWQSPMPPSVPPRIIWKGGSSINRTPLMHLPTQQNNIYPPHVCQKPWSWALSQTVIPVNNTWPASYGGTSAALLNNLRCLLMGVVFSLRGIPPWLFPVEFFGLTINNSLILDLIPATRWVQTARAAACADVHIQ